MASEKVLRRELTVGRTGTADELAEPGFPGVKIEVARRLSSMKDEEQRELGLKLAEMAVAAGILNDPLFLAKKLHAVVVSDREIYQSELDDQPRVGGIHYYFTDLFGSRYTLDRPPALLVTFFCSLDDAMSALR